MQLGVVVQEVAVDRIQEADLLEGSPAPVAHVDHTHQGNQSPLHGHQRGRDQPLQGVQNHVLVHVHRH